MMFVSIKYTPIFVKYIQVFLDGVDISKDCYAASDKHGIAFCYSKDENGKHYRINDKVARELRHGNVELRLLDNAPDIVENAWIFGRRI